MPVSRPSDPSFGSTTRHAPGRLARSRTLFEVATDFAFTNKVATLTVAEGPGQTAVTLTSALRYGIVHYWHARAFDPANNGPWSDIRAFITPPEAPAAPAPSPHPGGPAAGDAFNLATATIHASPAGVVNWPVTTSITSLSIRTDGVAVEFSKKSGPGRWPDVVPPGWSGGLQYTLWIAMNIGGAWHTCGPIRYWYGLVANGGDVTINNQIAVNWTIPTAGPWLVSQRLASRSAFSSPQGINA